MNISNSNLFKNKLIIQEQFYVMDSTEFQWTPVDQINFYYKRENVDEKNQQNNFIFNVKKKVKQTKPVLQRNQSATNQNQNNLLLIQKEQELLNKSVNLSNKKENNEVSSINIYLNYKDDINYCKTAQQFLYSDQKQKIFSMTNFKQSLNQQKLNQIIKGPQHIIKFSTYDQQQQQVFKQAIGSNISSSEVMEQFITIYIKLLLESRYTKLGILDQLRDRLDDIYFQCFKEVMNHLFQIFEVEQGVSLSYSNSFSENFLIMCISDLSKLFKLKNYIEPNNNQNDQFLKEIEGIVYKTIIYNGIFSISINLNTMNQSCFESAIFSLLAPKNIIPWSQKLHAGISIGGHYYSFNNRNEVHCQYITLRNISQKLKFLCLKLIDFFPLDDMVFSISLFIRNYIKSLILQFQDDYQIQFNKPNAISAINLTRSYMEQKFGQKDIIKQIFKKEKLDYQNDNNQMCNFQSMKCNLQSIEDKKLSTQLSPKQAKALIYPPIQPQQKKNWLNNKLKEKKLNMQRLYFMVIGQDYNYNVIDFTELQQYIEKNIQDQEISNKCYLTILNKRNYNKELYELLQKLANDFYLNYHYELEESTLLIKFCKLKAEAEFKQYNAQYNNCQTIVSYFVHYIAEIFQQTIEPIAKPKIINFNFDQNQLYNYFTGEFNIENIEKEDQRLRLKYFNKFGQLANYLIFNYQDCSIIIPAELETKLDYFGIFGDKVLKKYLSFIKQGQIDENKLFECEWLKEELKIKPFIKNFEKTIEHNQVVAKNLAYEQMFQQQNQLKTQNLQVQDQVSIQNSIQFKESQANVIIQEYEYNQNLSIFSPLIQQEDQQQNSIVKKITNIFQSLVGRKDPNKNNRVTSLYDPLQDVQRLSEIYSFYILLLNNDLMQLKQFKMTEEQKIEYKKKKNYLREALFIYYNSIRLKNSLKTAKNTISYIGWVIIKDPYQVFDKQPQNFENLNLN